MKLCRDLFGDYLDPQLNSDFKDALVAECELDMEDRTMLISLVSDTYIKADSLLKFRNTVKQLLKLNEINFSCKFGEPAFCVEAVADAVREIRRKNAALNGFFNGAEYEINGDTVSICLKYGGYGRICELSFEEAFCRLVKNTFNRDVKIAFTGQLEDVELIPPPPEPVDVTAERKPSGDKPEAKVEEPPKPEIKYDYKPNDGLPVYLESAKLFFGRKINADVMSLSDIIPPQNDNESVTISAWGEVFGCEIKE
ncbi:MAG: hypothetical protein IKK24_02555, partial [Clostridia bacterium]|nr:hypothetical protein [Clostridia bacterium]